MNYFYSFLKGATSLNRTVDGNRRDRLRSAFLRAVGLDLGQSFGGSKKFMKGSVSRETLLMCQWGGETPKVGIKQVDMSSNFPLEYWSFVEANEETAYT